MRGGEAWGIDYAEAAVAIARRALMEVDVTLREHTHVEQMDIKALRFDDGFFDVVYMMDVVEHLYPQELSRAFEELSRTIRPGGVLVMHTSPNKVFEERVYPWWSRRVNQAVLFASRRLRVADGLLNETMLPTGREFPHDEFERTMHINEQSAPRLQREVARHGFEVKRVEFWEPPSKGGYFESRRLNAELAVLDFVRFLRPLSKHAPLNRLFCNHIWMTAVRQ
jgi:SAM-dependent methyltransferase